MAFPVLWRHGVGQASDLQAGRETVSSCGDLV
jgi:hypothetical protein